MIPFFEEDLAIDFTRRTGLRTVEPKRGRCTTYDLKPEEREAVMAENVRRGLAHLVAERMEEKPSRQRRTSEIAKARLN